MFMISTGNAIQLADIASLTGLLRTLLIINVHNLYFSLLIMLASKLV